MQESNKDEKYDNVASKVSKHIKQRMAHLCTKNGLSEYELIQMVVETLVRNMDDQHNRTPEMERAVAIFEHMVGWKDAFNLADPSVDPYIVEAIYFLTADGKKGARAVHMQRPFFGDWKQDFNIQHILERTIELLSPQRYKRLRALAVNVGCNSLLDLIDYLIDYHTTEQDAAALRQDFEDADRSEYGKKPCQTTYKRRHNKNMDLFEAAERRKQEAERKRLEQESEEARKWLEDNMDFRPMGYEW